MELLRLVLSALLHDIGKFAQRAKRPYSKELQAEYLPVYKGKSSHWHALYSDYFIENDLPLPEELEEFRSTIARIASTHHRPDENNLEDMCVSIADRLSSGADRFEKSESESQPGFREARLISVFDEIELINHEFKSPGHFFYRLSPLDVSDDTVFPVKGKPEGLADEYKSLFDQFRESLGGLDIKSGPDFYIESLISFLECYTWAIPSSAFKTLSDIPLFDHSFSTSCIAQALYLYHKETGTIPAWQDKDEKFILVSGDLSGIQKYIFGISKSSGHGVSKLFRARSFYIQAVVQSVILKIQERTKVTIVCRLIDSGGKFMLLLPNTSGVVHELEKIDVEVQTWFRNKFKGQLTLPLSWETKLSQQDFQLNRFKDKIDESNESLDTVKLNKLHKTFKSQGAVIGHDYQEFEGGNCTLCQINAADDRSTEFYNESEGSVLPICRDCCDQITYIGRRLPRANYLIYDNKGTIPLFGDLFCSLVNDRNIHSDRYLCIKALSDDYSFPRARIARHLPSLSKEELQDVHLFSLLEKEDGFQDILDRFERDSEAFVPKTFSMIAAKSKKEIRNGEQKGGSKGRSLLGFLKADVDNLGFIFTIGLGDKLSIARLASLSRMLDLFFSEYLVALLKKEFPDIYVVFAGGDDLFLIGPWNQTIQFAYTMREKFSKFCGMNPDITLSCGLLVGKSRIPMNKAAEVTEQFLEEAKKATDQIKDSVSFLDKTMSWDEFKRLIHLGKIFDKALEEKERSHFSTAFLYRLLTYRKMYRDFINNGVLKAGKYLSQAHYDIARNIRKEDYNGNKEELDILYDIFSVGTGDRTKIDSLNIPIFYALNLNRNQ